jgi:hypothetical protein
VNTFNVRGWMTQSHQDFQEYISALAEDTKPQVIIVLTETKLAKKQQRNFFKIDKRKRKKFDIHTSDRIQSFPLSLP